MATTTKPLISPMDVAGGFNKLTRQYLGKDAITADTLDWVDLGSAYDGVDSNTQRLLTSGLISLVTEQLTVVKEFRGNGINLVRSQGPFNASQGIIQKNRPALPEAVSDSEVYDPAPGSSSDPFKNLPIASETEYFSKKLQFRYEWSQPERWLSGAFLSESGFNAFTNGVSRMVDNALALNIEAASMAAIRASMALNLHSGGQRAYNLLAEYNADMGATLTAAKCMQTPDFLRYAIHRMFVVFDYMKSYTSFYNEKGYPQFTNDDTTHFVLLSRFRRAMEQFLLSDTFHDDYLKLPLGDSVPAWKGFLLGANSPSFKATSTIDDTIDVSWESTPVKVNQSGILGTIFSTERVGIYNLGVRQTDMFDPVGLKTNYWTHVNGQSIVDPYENGVTFYVAD